jgi:hypothetical protein
MLSVQHGSIETVEPNETKTATDSKTNGFSMKFENKVELKFENKMRVVCLCGFVLSRVEFTMRCWNKTKTNFFSTIQWRNNTAVTTHSHSLPAAMRLVLATKPR